MSLEQGTRLRNGKIVDPSSEENTPENSAMAELNSNDSDTYESSDISSQLSEMKENYERKINELQSELCQLKDLMMAVINKTNSDSPSTSAQGPSKQPQLGRDKDGWCFLRCTVSGEVCILPTEMMAEFKSVLSYKFHQSRSKFSFSSCN